MTVGTDLRYPADLPRPQVLPSQSAERRVLDPRTTEARVGQTDRLAEEEYRFTLSPAQALAWDDFWRTTLNKGGKWFVPAVNRPWPRPEGYGETARRFIGTPAWAYIHAGERHPGGFWVVTGLFEVRGVGELPVEPAPPSTWNPNDKIAGGDLPAPMDLTENFRLATRNTRINSYEAGVRGTVSHAALGKWYFELELVSIGDGALPSDNQDMQFGILDATMLNESFYPLNDGSNPTNVSNFVVSSSRYDGIIFSSYPTFNATAGIVGAQPIVGDIFGFAWHVGTDLRVYKNGALVVTTTFPAVVAMFPYFNAGSTNANGPDTVGSGESVRIRTGKRQFAYAPPVGYFAWG